MRSRYITNWLLTQTLGIHILCSIVWGVGGGQEPSVTTIELTLQNSVTYGVGVQRTSILMLHNIWIMPYQYIVYSELNAKGIKFSILGQNKKASNHFYLLISSKCLIITYFQSITITTRYYSTEVYFNKSFFFLII